MANNPGAEKRIRQSARKYDINRPHIAGMRTAIKKFEQAVEEGSDNKQELFQAAVSSIDRAKSKGVIHRNNANRKINRLYRLNAN